MRLATQIFLALALLIPLAPASRAGGVSSMGTLRTFRTGLSFPAELRAGIFANPGDDLAQDSDFDSSGNVFVVGITFGAFPGFTNLGSYDCFLAKYDSGGTLLWVQQFGTNRADYCASVIVDSLGNIFVAGGTLGAFSGFTNQGGLDAMLVRLTSAGVVSWVQQLGTSSDDCANKVTVDSSRRPLIAGITVGAFSGFSSAGGQDIFLARYAANGTQNWLQQFGTAGNEQVFGMTIDSNNRTFLSGYTTGTFAGNTSAGLADAFVARYSNAGVQSWVRQFGTSADDISFDLSVVVSSGITNIVGYTNGTFPGNSSAGGEDIFHARYALNGTQTWIKQLGTSGDDEAMGALTDSSGNTYFAGFTYGAFSGFTNAGGADAVLIKYSNTGTQTWVHQFGTTGDDAGTELSGDATGITYVPGLTDAAFSGFTDRNGYDYFIAKYSNAGAQTWLRQDGTD